jgi:hypothetical protein
VVARGHDDLPISAALCTVLDRHAPAPTGTAELAQRVDPLEEIDGGRW